MHRGYKERIGGMALHQALRPLYCDRTVIRTCSLSLTVRCMFISPKKKNIKVLTALDPDH